MSKYSIGNASSLPDISSQSSGVTSDSFLSGLFQKPWNILCYAFIVIFIINIVVFLLRRYTTLLDYPIFEKILSVVPWLRK